MTTYEDEIAQQQQTDAVGDLREELDMVLSDWNAMTAAIGAPTNGTAVAHAKKLVAEVERLRASNKEKNRHLQHSAEVLRTSTEATVRHLNEIARLRALAEDAVKFLGDVHDNYDCDGDGHKYNTGCRSCGAGALLVKWAAERGIK